MKTPTYQINLPAVVRFDQTLSPSAKLLYGEIKALCDQQGYCWASNQYLAALYGVKDKVVSRWVNQLRTQGYLRQEVLAGNQRKIFLNGDLLKKGSPPPNSVDPIPIKVEGGIPDDRAETDLLLSNNIIDYNDRVDSTSTPNSSTKKWMAREGKNGENFAKKKSASRDVSEQPSVPEKPSPLFRSPPLPTNENSDVFSKPTVQQVATYMQGQTELCSNLTTAQAQAPRFVNYYQSNGWKVGRHPMQDWQAAARNWLLNAKNYEKTPRSYPQNPSEHQYASSRKKDYSIPL